MENIKHNNSLQRILPRASRGSEPLSFTVIINKGEIVHKTGTLTFKLAKLMIAVSWADGKIDNSEVNALKELLFFTSGT